MCAVTHVDLRTAVSLYWLLFSCTLLTAGQVVSVTELPACNATFFRCATSGCLNASLVCDGHDNCGDNSDEDVRYAGCPESHRLSGGLIAAIAIGSLVGAVLVCCWISSVIECIQHMYKYWCSCCHDADINDITFTTTVIPNPGADPTTIVIAGTLPPSYSSIFRNDAAFLAEASSTSLPNYQSGGSLYGVPPIGSLRGGTTTPPSGPRSLPQLTGGNMVISQHCQRCQCQCQRQQQQQQQQQHQQQLQQQEQQQQHQHHHQRQQLPQSASLPLPDYPPPSYDPAKDIRWC